jgi:hypothetical protein
MAARLQKQSAFLTLEPILIKKFGFDGLLDAFPELKTAKRLSAKDFVFVSGNPKWRVKACLVKLGASLRIDR